MTTTIKTFPQNVALPPLMGWEKMIQDVMEKSIKNKTKVATLNCIKEQIFDAAIYTVLNAANYRAYFHDKSAGMKTLYSYKEFKATWELVVADINAYATLFPNIKKTAAMLDVVRMEGFLFDADILSIEQKELISFFTAKDLIEELAEWESTCNHELEYLFGIAGL